MTRLKPGLELGSDGNPVGRDPRRMTPAELEAIGHSRMSPLAALRAHCIECANSAEEVRLCVRVRCSAWPFRIDADPWRAPTTEAQRQARRRNIGHARAARAGAVSGKETDAGSASSGIKPISKEQDSGDIPGTRSADGPPLVATRRSSGT